MAGSEFWSRAAACALSGLDSDGLDSDGVGSDIMRSMRRATVLLRTVALPTSARGARVPSSASVVISSTISMGSGLALRRIFVWILGQEEA